MGSMRAPRNVPAVGVFLAALGCETPGSWARSAGLHSETTMLDTYFNLHRRNQLRGGMGHCTLTD
jgi:hypothetical protein